MNRSLGCAVHNARSRSDDLVKLLLTESCSGYLELKSLQIISMTAQKTKIHC